MHMRFGLFLLLSALAGCSSAPEAPAVADQQRCLMRESRVGTHMLSRKCEPVTDEQRAAAQEEARAMKDEANRSELGRTLKP